MAVELDANFKKVLFDIENKISESDFDNLYIKAIDSYEAAQTKAAAEAAVLQYVHDQPYYKDIADTDLGKEVVKGVQSGSVRATPSSIQSTEKLLGEPTDSDVMTPRLDEEVLLKMFGAKDRNELLSWDFKNHWAKLPITDLKKLAEKSGLDYRAVINSMGQLQENYDREGAVEGFDPATGKVDLPRYAGSSFMGLFAPRTKEAIKMGKDPSIKDYTLDIASNAAQAVPYGRFAGLATKAIGLSKKATNPLARKTITHVGENALEPAAESLIDAVAYDDVENPYRSNVDLGKIIQGYGTNVATPLVVGGVLGKYSRAAGNRGLGRTAEEFMRGDPYLENLEKQVDWKNHRPNIEGKEALQDLINESIMKDLYKDLTDPKKIARLSKEQLDNYKSALQKQNNFPWVQQREIIKNNLMTGNPEVDEKLAYIFDESNPSYVSPTKLIGPEKAKKYGTTDYGLGYVGEDVIGTEHNFPSRAKKSAMDLYDERLKEVSGGNDPTKKSGDIEYPVRITDFDRTVDKLLKDENFMNRVRANRFGYKLPQQSLMSLTSNKLGREAYANRIIAPEQVEDLSNLTGISQKVKDYLADPTIIRQWKAGFKPNEDDTELYEAYKIYKAYEDLNALYNDGKPSKSTNDEYRTISSYKRAGL